MSWIRRPPRLATVDRIAQQVPTHRALTLTTDGCMRLGELPTRCSAPARWTSSSGSRRHPDRHELIDLVVRNGWGMDELARELRARFSARYDESAAG
jgi:hypothetical protein